jgi:hypothetical protein
MSFPKLTNGRVDPQLTNILLAYTNKDFIADRILPTVPNLKDETGVIASLGNAHLRIYDSRRALYDESDHRMEFTISNDKSYKIEYYDLEVYLPDRLASQLQLPFNAKRDSSISLRQAIMLEREAGIAALMTSTSILTNNTTLSGTSQYTDFVNSSPEDDFETARTSIHSKTGREANSVYMSRAVFNTLKRHPFFLNLVKGVKILSGKVLTEQIKDFFEVDDVIIGKAIYISTNEGQTETKSVLWGDDVVFFYKPSAPSLFEPSFGYCFKLQGNDLRVDIRRHEKDLGDIIRTMYAYQDKVLDVDAAYLIKDAI